MGYKQNLHTRTTVCNGKDTPKQMAQVALEKGFDSLGFSSHVYELYFPESYLPYSFPRMGVI